MKIPKLYVFALAGLVGLVLVVEILVRLLVSPPMDPGRTFILENDIPGLKKRVRFEIDPHQIRGWDSTKPKPAGSLRILCVGGGATTTMLQNVEDTWWGQLGTALEKSLGKPVQIGGLTAPSAARVIPGAQWADYLLGEVSGIDLVIAMYGHGEVIQPKTYDVFDPGAIKPMSFGKQGGLMSRLAKVSHLVRLVRNGRIKSKRDDQQRQFGQTNFHRDQMAATWQAFRSIPATTAGPLRENDPIAGYLHGLGLFAEVAKRHGVKLLVVGEPTVFSALISPDAAAALHSPVHVGPGERDIARPDPAWVDSELGRFYAAASNFCTGVGLPFVNLQGTVLPARSNFFTETTLTDEGAAAAAAALLPTVEELLK